MYKCPYTKVSDMTGCGSPASTRFVSVTSSGSWQLYGFPMTSREMRRDGTFSYHIQSLPVWYFWHLECSPAPILSGMAALTIDGLFLCRVLAPINVSIIYGFSHLYTIKYYIILGLISLGFLCYANGVERVTGGHRHPIPLGCSVSRITKKQAHIDLLFN